MTWDLAAWLPVPIIVPLAAALLAFALPRRGFPIALIGGGLTALSVGYAVLRLTADGSARHIIGGWGAPLGIDLALDGLSAIMLLLTAVIGLAITVYAHGYFHGADAAERRRYSYFWPLWLFLWTALNALFLSGDSFNLYVTLELLGFSAVALTALAGTPAVLKAAMRYLLVSLTGSLLYLCGIAFLYGGFGVLDIALLRDTVTATPALAAAAALITAGLVMKTALFPLHFWLPAAHANAAAPVSAALSALVVKGSFYILIRLWLDVLYPLADTAAPILLMLLGCGAILWGSVQALRQTRLKLLIAYSTVAQLGYLFLLLPVLVTRRDDTLALAGIACFVVAHGVAKAAAFLSAGNILHAVGHDRLAGLNGLLAALPASSAAFALAGISLIGLPPSAGFIGKWLLLDTAWRTGQWGLLAVILIGGLLAGGYVMRVVAPFFRKRDDDAPPVHAVPLVMVWPTIGLAVLAIALGFAGVYLIALVQIGGAA